MTWWFTYPFIQKSSFNASYEPGTVPSQSTCFHRGGWQRSYSAELHLLESSGGAASEPRLGPWWSVLFCPSDFPSGVGSFPSGYLIIRFFLQFQEVLPTLSINSFSWFKLAGVHFYSLQLRNTSWYIPTYRSASKEFHFLRNFSPASNKTESPALCQP